MPRRDPLGNQFELLLGLEQLHVLATIWFACTVDRPIKQGRSLLETFAVRSAFLTSTSMQYQDLIVSVHQENDDVGISVGLDTPRSVTLQQLAPTIGPDIRRRLLLECVDRFAVQRTRSGFVA